MVQAKNMSRVEITRAMSQNIKQEASTWCWISAGSALQATSIQHWQRLLASKMLVGNMWYKYRILNSSPGGLMPITLPLGHGGSPQNWISHVDGEEAFFVSFKPPRPGTEPRILAWKAAVLTTTLGPPPQMITNMYSFDPDIAQSILTRLTHT